MSRHKITIEDRNESFVTIASAGAGRTDHRIYSERKQFGTEGLQNGHSNVT